jgi:DnaD/phage-associated family protein
MSKYWIKLYHEMIDDPKVARLNDSAYRLFIECLLLAGELDEEGLLPPVEDMAWRLRKSETALPGDMANLANAGMVELIRHSGGERWFVSNFEKRQAPNPNAQRQAKWREKQRKEPKESSSLIDTDTDTDTDTYGNVTNNVTSNDDADFATVVSAYENNISMITPIMSETIQAAIDEFGAENIVEAIGLAVKSDVRKWSYVNGILKRWRKDGKQERNAVKVENGGMYV